MSTASEVLRVQLLDVVAQLCTVGTVDEAVATPEVKQELRVVSSLIAKLHKDVRPSLERAIALLSTSDPASNTPALALVARAAAALAPPLTPRPTQPTRAFPLPTELIAHILNLVHPLEKAKERQSFLMTSALVSRAFYRAAHVYLATELAITHAQHFEALSSKLEHNANAFYGIRVLALDFDTDLLRDSLADGKTWLAPLSTIVLSALANVKHVTVGSQLLDICLNQEENLESLFCREMGVKLAAVMSPDALTLEATHMRSYYFDYPYILVTPWQATVKQLKILAEQPRDNIYDDITGDGSTLNVGELIEFVNAPNLATSPSMLLNALPSACKLAKLSFTLFVGPHVDHAVTEQEIAAAFDRLSPTLTHLSLSLLDMRKPQHGSLHNQLISSIAGLLHLQHLELDGGFDLAASPQQLHFASALATLPIVSLVLAPKKLFKRPDDSLTHDVDLPDVLQSSSHYPSLRHLTIYYINGDEDDWEGRPHPEKRDYIPVELYHVCQSRGIKLRLLQKRVEVF